MNKKTLLAFVGEFIPFDEKEALKKSWLSSA